MSKEGLKKYLSQLDSHQLRLFKYTNDKVFRAIREEAIDKADKLIPQDRDDDIYSEVIELINDAHFKMIHRTASLVSEELSRLQSD